MNAAAWSHFLVLAFFPASIALPASKKEKALRRLLGHRARFSYDDLF
jgi:hypothetical protein